MHIHTIEMNYDHRITRVIAKLIADFEATINNGDELEQFLWDNATEFGKAVVEDMSVFDDGEGWLEQVEQL